MKFESKAHMAQALLEGRRFKYADDSSGVAFYNDDKDDPFRFAFYNDDESLRFDDKPIGTIWNWYSDDNWEEVTPQTKTVYEWMFFSKNRGRWFIDGQLLSEGEAKLYYEAEITEYRKTGRSWEVDV